MRGGESNRRAALALLLAGGWAVWPCSRLAAQTPDSLVSFQSAGSTLQGVLYRAVGEGKRPSVLLLPGFPSRQVKDIHGLGPRLAAAGWNALVIHYRGVGSNEGIFAPSHSIADVVAAVDYLQNEDLTFVASDPIAVVGLSYGGWAALLAAARDPRIDCVGAIAPANLGQWARQIGADPEFRRYMVNLLEATTTGSPARGLGGEATVARMLEHATEFDLTVQAAALAGRPVLVVGGWRDEGTPLELHVLPLVRALQDADTRGLTPVVLDADHGFAGRDEELRRVVLGWLGERCQPVD